MASLSAPARPLPRWRMLLLFYGFALVFVMVTHGWRDLNVALHEAQTTATVTGGSRRGVTYQYQASGQTFSGEGHPGIGASWLIGSTFPIRYTTTHPSYSTPEWPLGFLGQLAIIWAFMTVMLLAHFKSKKATASPASAGSPLPNSKL